MYHSRNSASVSNRLVSSDLSRTYLSGDYIDLFLIHDPMSGRERRLQTYKALQEARAEGKIRSVGVSNLSVGSSLSSVR